jgi:hypothetical protein
MHVLCSAIMPTITVMDKSIRSSCRVKYPTENDNARGAALIVLVSLGSRGIAGVWNPPRIAGVWNPSLGSRVSGTRCLEPLAGALVGNGGADARKDFHFDLVVCFRGLLPRLLGRLERQPVLVKESSRPVAPTRNQNSPSPSSPTSCFSFAGNELVRPVASGE